MAGQLVQIALSPRFLIKTALLHAVIVTYQHFNYSLILSAKPSRYLNSVLEHACNYLIMCLLIFQASLTSGHPQPAAEQEEFSTELPAMRTQLQLHGYTSM